MSEREMKKVSVVALVFGIITSFLGLMGLTSIPLAWWQTVSPYRADEFDIIEGCLAIPGLLSIVTFMGPLLPIPAAALVLSIITLFIEPNKRRRLLPLLFTLLGLYLFFASLALLWFSGGWP